jgi:hypothetical protein
MLQRFLNWRTRRRERREAHDRAWLPAVAVTPDGLSTFIHSARGALINACGEIHFELRGTAEKYLCGTLPGTSATVYLNGDGAQIHDGPRELFWSEYHDYDNPEHLVNSLVESSLGIMASAAATPSTGAHAGAA